MSTEDRSHGHDALGLAAAIDAGRIWLTQHGDFSAPSREILRTVVGSGVHGIAIAGSDDHDEMGIYIEAPEHVLGLRAVGSMPWSTTPDSYVARTVPEGMRSEHGDVDLVLYSLRRYLAMVATGHPTALLPIFAPPTDVLICSEVGLQLREFGPALLSQRAGWRFLGYLRAQRERMVGSSRSGVPNRPELVAAHGFDTKYASHALRLAYQGLEVALTGTLTLPLPAHAREACLAVKRGEVAQAAALEMIDELEGQLTRVLEGGVSPLPELPDLEAASAWSARVHRAYWAAMGW